MPGAIDRPTLRPLDAELGATRRGFTTTEHYMAGDRPTLRPRDVELGVTRRGFTTTEHYMPGGFDRPTLRPRDAELWGAAMGGMHGLQNFFCRTFSYFLLYIIILLLCSSCSLSGRCDVWLAPVFG